MTLGSAHALNSVNMYFSGVESPSRTPQPQPQYHHVQQYTNYPGVPYPSYAAAGQQPYYSTFSGAAGQHPYSGAYYATASQHPYSGAYPAAPGQQPYSAAFSAALAARYAASAADLQPFRQWN